MMVQPLHPVFPMPTGLDQLGHLRYGNYANRIPAPPNALHESIEHMAVKNAAIRNANDPNLNQFTSHLLATGDSELWKDFARQYRSRTGLLRGWLGTALMHIAMGSASLKTTLSSGQYRRLRPYQVDPSIPAVISSKPSRLGGYPAKESARANAAATTLSMLWPARAYEFNWWARQVDQSRVFSGQNYPSDVRLGAQIGRASALNTVGFLR